jgi:hypothetical protein
LVPKLIFGLCETCRYAKIVRSDRGSTFLRCLLSDHDARFPKYPRLPVVKCDGYLHRDAEDTQGHEEKSKTPPR